MTDTFALPRDAIDADALALLCRSHAAQRLGIVNDPRSLPFLVREQVLGNLAGLWRHIVAPLVAAWPGLQIGSGYRSPELNLAVRGSKNSQHLRGQAADVEVPGIPNRDLAAWCADRLPFDQLILEFWRPDDPAAGWVHVSWAPPNEAPRRQVLRTEDGRTFHAGLPA